MNFEGFSVPVKTKLENFTERVRVGMDDEVPGAIRVYTVRRERDVSVVTNRGPAKYTEQKWIKIRRPKRPSANCMINSESRIISELLRQDSHL
jgi:hypothetical protein